MHCSVCSVYSTPSVSLFPDSFLGKELGISDLPTPCLRQHWQSSVRAKNHQPGFGASTSFRLFWKRKQYLCYSLRKKYGKLEAHQESCPSPMAAVCKSEPSSRFATDIYLPTVRLQQRNSREQQLGQRKIALQHYLLPSHMSSHTFNGYFKLKQLLKHPVARAIIFFPH